NEDTGTGGGTRPPGLALDGSNNVYIVGENSGGGYPMWPAGNIYSTQNGGRDIVVTKLHNDGKSLDSSIYLGSGDDDYAAGIALDSSGKVYVAGYTESSSLDGTAPTYPTTAGVVNQTIT